MSTKLNIETLWSPKDAAPELWFDAADPANFNKSGTAISQWNDRSGNDYHASEGTGTQQPEFVDNDLNGMPGVKFDDDDLRGTHTHTAAFVIGIIKGTNTTWPAWHAMFDRNNASDTRIGGIMLSGGTGFYNIPTSVELRKNAEVTAHNADWGPITEAHMRSFVVPPGPTENDTFSMGNYDALLTGGGGTHYEIIVLPTVPDTATRQKLEGYLMWKWGLNYHLPEDHPYKYDGTLFGYVNLWTPAIIDTRLWLDASDTSAANIVESGNKVSQWTDKSGDSYSLTQPNGSFQPTTNTRTINGLNAIDFANDWMQAQWTLDAQPLSYFAVVQYDDATAQYICDGYGSSPRNIVGINAAKHYLFGGGALDSGIATDTSPALVYAQTNGTSSEIAVDGGTAVVGNAGTQGSNGITLGHRFGGSGATLNGLLGEFIIVPSAVSLTIKQKFEGYFAHKWSLTANLPAGHPYKSVPPTV